MKSNSILILGLAALAIATAGACSKPAGHLVVGIKDGPPTSSDGRTITKLEIDISRVELTRDDPKNTPNTPPGQDDGDIVVFNAGTGAPLTVDLLKVTTFSALVGSVNPPAGTYGGAEVVVTGARAVFADAPSTTVTLSLEGDGHSKAEFDFKFKPPAKVTDTATTMAVIDFVPIVNKDGTSYKLNHDGNNDQSGEVEDHNELEVTAKIVTLDLIGKKLTLDGAVSKVDFSAAKLKPATATLAVGQTVEVEGAYDKATDSILAHEINIK
jgi:hypothetical protein